LLPVDGSPCSETALREGLRLADKCGYEPTIVYVVENPLLALPVLPEGIPYEADLYDDLKKAGNEVLARAEALAREVGVSVKTALVEGQPISAISDMAKDFAMLIMGTHGRGGLEKLIIGSVTEGVLHRSKTPVLVINCKHHNQ